MARREFRQVVWDETLASDWGALLALALREDLGELGDLTTRSLVPPDIEGQATIVARKPGVLAGLPTVLPTLRAVDPRLQWRAEAKDGAHLVIGQALGRILGPAASILAAERLVLNVLGRLCGVATLTRTYVDAISGTQARIYDTRKTTPGWRRLEKYAVRCGGGCNHRTSLCEAILIKDNHLAFGVQAGAAKTHFGPAQAVRQAKQWAVQEAGLRGLPPILVEVEVDTLEQLEQVLPEQPDLVLLDNMTPPQLRQAVDRRNALASDVELEASGGIQLSSVRAIAEAGVDRISVGALTHSAIALDVSLDWQ
jgi:nicotinate-nucleotide pyrophosphorylase (carboxylating)